MMINDVRSHTRPAVPERFPVGIGAAAMLAIAPMAMATVRNVPATYATIQAGINASIDGDTVLVAPGTYAEAINYNGRRITVSSSGGSAVTTINATGLNTSAVTMNFAGVSQAALSGFTVTGGAGTLSGPRNGGGLNILGGGNATITLTDCIFATNIVPNSGQTSSNGGGIFVNSGTLTMRRCALTGNTLSATCNINGAGLYNAGAVVTMVECLVTKNSGSALQCTGNAIARGAGMYLGGSTTLVNCEIRGNGGSANNGNGGGIYATANVTLINCLIANNTSPSGGAVPGGGGIYATADVVAHACTIATNNGGPITSTGGIQTASGGALMIDNSIMYNNAGTQISGTATVTRCCVQNGFSGFGNISSNPMFINASGPDYHLQNGSPCRDVGDRTLLPADTFDLDGDFQMVETLSRDLDVKRRVVNGQVDMGAYEWQHPCQADISPSSPGVAGNGQIDIDDLVAVITGWGDCDQCIADVNGDGHVNIDDLVLVITGWGACP